MAKRFNLRIPGIGKWGTGRNAWIILAGLGALGGLAYLAYSNKTTGIPFIDRAAGQFEDIYEDYLGPLGPAGGAGAPMAKPVQMAPVVPSRGLNFDDLVFSGAYATDAPLPYSDWWSNDTSSDDRIIVA